MDIPAQSSDLNIIEHIWDEVGHKVYYYIFYIFSNIQGLKVGILAAWNSITPEMYENLVRSIPRRLEAVISNKGYATKY